MNYFNIRDLTWSQQVTAIRALCKEYKGEKGRCTNCPNCAHFKMKNPDELHFHEDLTHTKCPNWDICGYTYMKNLVEKQRPFKLEVVPVKKHECSYVSCPADKMTKYCNYHQFECPKFK